MAVKFPDAKKREALAQEHGANLQNWRNLSEKPNNITGDLPKYKEKMAPEKTNAQLAKEWGVTNRQASKIRNYKRPLPGSENKKAA